MGGLRIWLGACFCRGESGAPFFLEVFDGASASASDGVISSQDCRSSLGVGERGSPSLYSTSSFSFSALLSLARPRSRSRSFSLPFMNSFLSPTLSFLLTPCPGLCIENALLRSVAVLAHGLGANPGDSMRVAGDGGGEASSPHSLASPSPSNSPSLPSSPASVGRSEPQCEHRRGRVTGVDGTELDAVTDGSRWCARRMLSVVVDSAACWRTSSRWTRCWSERPVVRSASQCCSGSSESSSPEESSESSEAEGGGGVDG